MRTALVLLLIHGLTPAAGELVEAAVHYVVEGHLAHTEADHGDLGDQGDEHGCGSTQHRCDCCASQAVAVAPPGATALRAAVVEAMPPPPAGPASRRAPAPPLRPPIPS